MNHQAQLLKDLNIPPNKFKMFGATYIYKYVWSPIAEERRHDYYHENYWSRPTSYWIRLDRDKDGLKIKDWRDSINYKYFCGNGEPDMIFIKDMSILFDFIATGYVEVV